MTIEGDYSLFAHLETVYLGCMARRTLIMRNVRDVVEAAQRQADPLLPRPPRPLARADGRRLGRARGGRDRRLHRRAGVVVGRPRHRHRPARADRRLRRRHGARRATFADRFAERDERHGAGRLRQRLGRDRARGRRGARGTTSGACGWTPPTRSPTALRRRSAATRRAASRPSSSSSREALDAAGFPDVRIVVSGGFNAERIRGFEARGVPVDAYGVGSSLIRGANDFTADVVMVDGAVREGRARAAPEPAPRAPWAELTSGTKRTRSSRRSRAAAEPAQEHEALVAVLDRRDQPAARRELVQQRRRDSRRRRGDVDRVVGRVLGQAGAAVADGQRHVVAPAAASARAARARTAPRAARRCRPRAPSRASSAAW